MLTKQVQIRGLSRGNKAQVAVPSDGGWRNALSGRQKLQEMEHALKQLKVFERELVAVFAELQRWQRNPHAVKSQKEEDQTSATGEWSSVFPLPPRPAPPSARASARHAHNGTAAPRQGQKPRAHSPGRAQHRARPRAAPFQHLVRNRNLHAASLAQTAAALLATRASIMQEKAHLPLPSPEDRALGPRRMARID